MTASHDHDTIIAQCTPQGSGALALLRISGNRALEIASLVASIPSGIPLHQLPSHTVHFGCVRDLDGLPIDQVMFIVMHGPRTFTGQDTVEITPHNNQFVVAEIIEHALYHGARLAHEGEFTRRAVLGGKIDLLQAEAIHELIHANTRYALKKSLAQLDGSFSRWIDQLNKNLLKVVVLSEASFEFLDEEMEFDTTIRQIVAQTLQTVTDLKKTFNQQQQIKQGIRIAIIGSVNAGKSSLFNALLNKNRAIVTDIAGTTRDVIEANLYKNDAYWTLIDTAGVRETDDIIEREGVIRSHHEAAQADIILLVFDQTRVLSAQEKLAYQDIMRKHGNKVITVANKEDKGPGTNNDLFPANSVSVSSTTHTNIQLLEQRIQEKINELLTSADAPFLLNQRQYNLLLGLEQALHTIMQLLNQKIIAYELLSIHVRDAIAHMSELTGKTISEQAMDTIFREFCIGK